MRNLTRTYFTRALVWLLSSALALTPVAVAQSNTSALPRPVFTQQELDQMLAPIALYPDALLSQILMASGSPPVSFSAVAIGINAASTSCT